MDKITGPLLLIASLVGLVVLVLSAAWLIRRRSFTLFKKIVVTFVFVGAVIPAVVAPSWFWINSHGSPYGANAIEWFAVTFWPTSIALMALADFPGPVPRSTMVFVYAFSMISNVGLYGSIGLLLAWACHRTARPHRPTP